MCHSYRLLACFSLIAGLVASAPVHAQTTPTAFENQVGQACSKGSSSTDFDTLTQCTSTGATAGTFQKAPLFVGAVTSPPYATTTCDANKAGMIQYTASAMQYCNGTAWASFGASALGTTATATSPSRSGDAGTGLFSDTATTIAVAAGGTERLRVTSTGITVFGNVDVFSYSDLNHYSIQGDKILHHGGNDQTSIGVGRYTLYNHVPAGLMDANYNTAIGSSALFNTTTGDANVAVGSRAGQNITTGSNNTVIGFQSGETLTTGNNNILIGSFVNVPAATTSDWMNLGGAIVADLTLGSVAIGAAAVTTGSSFDLSARSDSMILPKGEAALRPVAPVEGMVRYNTDTQNMEVYQGSSPDWVTVGPSTLGSAASSNNPHAAGDVNTGLFSDTANTVSIATAGDERVRVGANGAVTLGSAAATAGSVLDLAAGTGTALSSMIVPKDTTANRPTTGVPGMVRYNTTTEDFEGFKGSAWASLSAPASGTNAQSMVAGWPDIISCTSGSTTYLLNLYGAPNATGYYGYRLVNDPTTTADFRVFFTAAGAYYSNVSLSGYDCISKTIATLVSEGKAFNIANGQAGGTAEMQYGTAGAPGLYFTDDNNTGFYRPAADTLGFAAGGVERLRITATGNLSIGGADPTAGAVLDLAAATGTARSSMIVPNDTTANRPTTGVAGMFRYNTTDNVFEGYTGSSWRSFHSDSGVNAQSIKAGWPDAIYCIDASSRVRVLYTASMPNATGKFLYYNPYDTGTSVRLGYNSDGTYDSGSAANMTGFDCLTNTWSIAQLIANGRAFNIANGQAGGTDEMQDGTAGAPGLYFTDDNNTGFYRPAADTLGFAAGGVERLRITATGNLSIGGADPTAGAVLDLAAATGTARSSMIAPKDTTANRPTTGVAGMFRYNTTDNVFEGYTGASWRSFHSDSGVNAQSMFAGWPDAIVCTSGVVKRVLIALQMPEGTNLYHYRMASLSNNYDVYFTAAGAYSSNNNMTGYDCLSRTIATLIAEGKAFNFTNGQAGGTDEMQDGTAGAPGLFFSADTNTGLYRPAEDVIGFATGGVERIRVDASGNVSFGAAAPTAGVALDLATATGTARSSILLPKDTTANRPTTGVEGMIRYNTTTKSFEGYQGSTPEWAPMARATNSLTTSTTTAAWTLNPGSYGSVTGGVSDIIDTSTSTTMVLRTDVSSTDWLPSTSPSIFASSTSSSCAVYKLDLGDGARGRLYTSVTVDPELTSGNICSGWGVGTAFIIYSTDTNYSSGCTFDNGSQVVGYWVLYNGCGDPAAVSSTGGGFFMGRYLYLITAGTRNSYSGNYMNGRGKATINVLDIRLE